MAGARATTPPRERLLQAADELFYDRGIASTGVDAVLARAGASPATLYAHFSSKDGLVAAYLQRRHARWRSTWDAVLAEAEDPVGRLLSVLDALALFRRRAAATRGCAVLAAAAELAADHPAQVWIAADTALLYDRLHELAVAAGADDPRALVTELVLVYDGTLAAHARRAADPTPTARDLARAAIGRHLTATSA